MRNVLSSLVVMASLLVVATVAPPSVEATTPAPSSWNAVDDAVRLALFNARFTIRHIATTFERPTAYFRNCADARAAGAVPLHRGDPGYRAELDGNDDGVACE